MNRIVACVPNFSEGRDRGTIQALIDAVTSTAGVALLDHTMDPDHHRAVLTFCGTPEAIVEAAFRAIRIATDLIDLRKHVGVHPRVGATDVVPFIPISGTTMQDCVQLAKRLGEKVGRELEIPVFLYEGAAAHADHAPLETIRRGGLEGLAFRMASNPDWTPDFGPTRLHLSAGAVAIGARPPLIAYNVNLYSKDVETVRSIARTIRHSSGGLPHLKAIGVELASRGMVQIAMNVTDYQVTSLLTAFQAVTTEAGKRGIEVAGSELIGLVPQAALDHAAAASLKLDRFDSSQILEARIAETMLKKDEIKPTLPDFLAAVAEAKPTPAGGSVAALVGALAASLGVMGARLSQQSDSAVRLLELSHQLHRLVQEDSDAYSKLGDAYLIPKARPDRPRAVSMALQRATEVPLEIAEAACEVGWYLHALREKVKPAVRSDLTVGLTMAIAAAQSGLSTANTNMNSLINHDLVSFLQVRMAKATANLDELRGLC
ncbi:MAG: glutamate formimidoyltransferase [Nitrospira sp.]|nr:glutamate formimidoyltransferase [Nitrospira sp.]MDH4368540.1 glutamate formimidoyltransferase [Nitrospira sp.]MDH5347114.1 glutamate formimidoyltransferase [Nitrospira sp.]MDH5497000.1 glutamate formimidoyltransferase [Nitrospira sp.]MDH5724195.1 glutamate formimidoyltransferase [Nitrospira sp.]